MEKVISDLKIKMVKLVETKCQIYDINTYFRDNFNYDRCLSCAFIVDKENARCGHYEYETDIVRHSDYTDGCECGAMPSTDYCKVIKCANCGSEVEFHSGYSHLVHGDGKKCHKCGLLHVFFGRRDEKVVFSIPIVDMDSISTV